MNFFNYDESHLLDDFEKFEDIPDNVLNELIEHSNELEEMAFRLEWLEENLEAIKAGYKDKKEFEDDNMNLMYPEGHGDDVDGDVVDDD